MSTGIDEAKQAIRRRIWDLLVQEGVVERGVHGYIPAFVGAATAADRLAGLPEWRAAQVVKAVPDRAQQPVRERALRGTASCCTWRSPDWLLTCRSMLLIPPA